MYNINTKTISLKFGRLKELMCLSNKWKKKKILVSNQIFFWQLTQPHVDTYFKFEACTTIPSDENFLKGRRDQRNYNFYYFVTFFWGTDDNSSEVDRTFFFVIIENGLMTFV